MGDAPTTSSLDNKVDFGDIDAGTGVTGRRGKKKKYNRYNNNDVVIEALSFYNHPLGSSLTSYCKEDGR
jgi:adenine-specific DNA methylase